MIEQFFLSAENVKTLKIIQNIVGKKLLNKAIKVPLQLSGTLERGHREGGRLGLVKIFKTPFFKRYLKFFPSGDSFRSRTSPIFFFLKYLNKYSR